MAKKRSQIGTDFLRQLDRFRLVLKKRVSSKYQGARDTDYAGSGLTFKDYKDYVPGDDFRNIDWKVFARTDKHYVRRFEEERNLTVHIIIDASTSMDYGDPRKFDYAALIGLGFAYLALRNNEKFEFSTFAEELRPLRAKKGMKQLLGILDYLNDVPVRGKSEFQKSIESAKSLIKSRSLVVLLSDFLYDVQEIKHTLSRFKFSEVLCVQVLDRVEREFAVEGDVILRDSENEKTMRTYVSRRVRHDYRNQLDEHIAEIRRTCEQLKDHFVTVTTDMDPFDAFHAAYAALQH